jgi:heme/copper-type cytochrome/quinol oxidase subunit 3
MSMIKRSILLFIASESIFFILLILSFLHYQVTHGQAEAGPQLLDVIRTGKFSFLLLFSSFTVWMAIRGMRHQKNGAMSFWLLATIGLGIAFLYGQGTEWWGLIQQDVTISRDLFGTTFFTLTGFHGFHVFIGLIMLAALLGLTLAGAIHDKSQEAADSISIYWHFVDGVWIVVFTVIYLVPLM